MVPVITSSWDDGHPLDMRMADLLARCGVAGTFYVPLQNAERQGIARSDLRALATHFEIGAHTRTHVRLPDLSTGQLAAEIGEAKGELETLLGRPVTAFCYPGGRFSRTVRKVVGQAGFRAARTTMAFRWSWEVDPLLLPTSVQAFPHSPHVHIRHAIRERNLLGLWNYVVQLRAARDWVRLALRQLERALASGGWWHLWGHSWEIDQLGAWPQVELVLGEAGAAGARSCTNSELAGLIRCGRS